jgi:hypothetical protein
MAKFHPPSDLTHYAQHADEGVNTPKYLAHPRFLRKELSAQKTAGRGRGKLMGWRHSDHHPEAAVLPLDRARPEEICRGRGLSPLFSLEGSLSEEYREEFNRMTGTRRA